MNDRESNYRVLAADYNIARRNLLPKEQLVFDKAFDLLQLVVVDVSTPRSLALEAALIASLTALTSSKPALSHLVLGLVNLTIETIHLNIEDSTATRH